MLTRLLAGWVTQCGAGATEVGCSCWLATVILHWRQRAGRSHAIHSAPKENQRTNGPVSAHLRPEIYTCTNKPVRLEWYNSCI